jgi:hypothetical protein
VRQHRLSKDDNALELLLLPAIFLYGRVLYDEAAQGKRLQRYFSFRHTQELHT